MFRSYCNQFENNEGQDGRLFTLSEPRDSSLHKAKRGISIFEALALCPSFEPDLERNERACYLVNRKL